MADTLLVSIPIGKLSLIGLAQANYCHVRAIDVSIPIGKLSLIGRGHRSGLRPSGRVSIPIGKLSLIGLRHLPRHPRHAQRVSIPIGKLSLIGRAEIEVWAVAEGIRRFNSHWEVESHWTHLRKRWSCGGMSSFNSHWEVESHWTTTSQLRLASPRSLFQFPLGS